MKKTIFEEMGGIYIRHGDYLIPCLTFAGRRTEIYRVWGQRHLRYLLSSIAIPDTPYFPVSIVRAIRSSTLRLSFSVAASAF